MKRFRDSKVGRFVTKATAMANPDTTTAESISDCPKQLATANWRISDLETVLMQTAGDLRTMVMHKSATDEHLSKMAKHIEDTLNPPGDEKPVE